jgi:amino acid permease
MSQNEKVTSFLETDRNNRENPLDKPNEDQDITESEKEENQNETKTWKERLFGPIDPGSIRGSIFNLSILSLGSGCLALPQSFGKMSILVNLIDIIIAAFASYWTLSIMIFSSEKYKVYSYSKINRVILGKGYSIFFDIIMLVYIFGVIILFQVIIYKLLGGIVNEFGQLGYSSMEDFSKNSFWKGLDFKFPIMFTIVLFILFPLCIIDNISKMRFNSMFGLFSLIFLFFIIIFEFPWYFKNYWDKIYIESDESTHLNIWDISQGFTKNLNFFKGTATLFFAFSCHGAAFPVYNELKNKNTRRIQKVFARSIILNSTFYIIVGLTGYLSDPINTPDLIIERYKLFSSDILMTLGWICFLFALLMKIPANYVIFRLVLLNLFGYSEDIAIPFKVYFFIT